MRFFSRRPAARRATRPSGLRLDVLESRTVPAMTLHTGLAFPHGTLLHHVPIQSVYFASPSAKSGYMAMLSKAHYGVGSGTSEPGFVDSAVAISNSQVSDAQLQAELQNLILNDPRMQQPNKNRLYQVFVAPTIEVTTSFGT